MSTITPEQALALAPDSSSATAGKKLAVVKHWKNLGRTVTALWGECQGSALYQVRVDLNGMAVKCSCPSRKLPCKHGLGLILLSVNQPGALPESEPPEWAASWLAKRSAPKDATPKASAASPEKAAAQAAKTAAKREKGVSDGLDTLDLWLTDLVRNGIGALEGQPTSFWEAQAARMTDAKAPGVATRLRRIAGIPGAFDDWPAKLLGELGRLSLLIQAYRRLDTLDESLREDVRQLIGWTLNQDELAARGEHVSDRWTVLGQWIDDQDRGREQRTWLLGERSGRLALVLQFSFANQPFPESFIPGSSFDAELHFYPGAYPLRARVAERAGEPVANHERLPGSESVEAFLRSRAEVISRQPWLDRFGCVLRDVTPVCVSADSWWARDETGVGLPLEGSDHWRLLALSGGNPVDLIGEWDGETLLPLGMIAEGIYTPLWGVN
ncbi:MAG TPA: SWIM zinc finger family protein [Ktedonobacterales bacterium]|jgi:hypothetical protein